MSTQQRARSEGYAAGLEAAADYLERTAENFMQKAYQVHIPVLSGSSHDFIRAELARKQAFIDKADLLKERAANIRGLQNNMEQRL